MVGAVLLALPAGEGRQGKIVVQGPDQRWFLLFFLFFFGRSLFLFIGGQRQFLLQEGDQFFARPDQLVADLGALRLL